MTTLDEYLTAAKRLSRREFISTYPYAVLLLHDRDDGDDSWAFKTHALGRPRDADADDAEERSEVSRFTVLPLVKALANPWRDRISVGRARNTDVVIQDKSVSKLHAYFTTSDDGSIALSDAGSRNGTWVGKTQLSGAANQRLQSRDGLTFGAVRVTFVTNDDLYDLLSNGEVNLLRGPDE